MTKAIGGDVIEAVAHPDLLAPGTVRRPAWIDETTWARMPWPAQWKAARRAAPAARDSDDDTRAPRVYRGGTTPEQPCGTYAAYRRHLRRGEAPCEPCAEANRRDTNQRYRLKHGRSRPTGLDPQLVDSFIRDEALWQDLSVEERIEAARRMDANGIRRNVIARRTRLNSANLRRAFTVPAHSTELSTGCVDEIPCPAQAMERTG